MPRPLDRHDDDLPHESRSRDGGPLVRIGERRHVPHLRSWGANNFGGELGDGLAEDTSAVPVAVSGGNSYVTISAGTFHTCAVRTDLVLFCWGSNGGGELGDGTTVARSTPVRVAEP